MAAFVADRGTAERRYEMLRDTARAEAEAFWQERGMTFALRDLIPMPSLKLLAAGRRAAERSLGTGPVSLSTVDVKDRRDGVSPL